MLEVLHSTSQPTMKELKRIRKASDSNPKGHGCGSRNRNSKMGYPGKWKHRPKPAVCPSDRLSHTQIRCFTRPSLTFLGTAYGAYAAVLFRFWERRVGVCKAKGFMGGSRKRLRCLSENSFWGRHRSVEPKVCWWFCLQILSDVNSG